MNKFSLIYYSSFEKDFSKLSNNIAREIAKAIVVLEENPFIGKNIKKITSSQKKYFRLRVGDYRIIYRIKSNCVYLLRIINRKDLEKALKQILKKF